VLLAPSDTATKRSDTDVGIGATWSSSDPLLLVRLGFGWDGPFVVQGAFGIWDDEPI
jgi:hypothetical protein